MLDEVADRTLPREALAEMVRVVRPDWRLREATLAEAGWSALYHLVVGTDAGPRACVLKATPDADRPGGIATEARIQAVVREHTAIPAPAVFGAVDDHPRLRTPYFLMEALPGESVPRDEVAALPDAVVRRVARESGRYLGQLHVLDAGLDRFGETLDHDRSTPLRGEPPSGDPAPLGVSDGYDRWPARLRDWFETDFRLLAESRFRDLAPALRAEQARRLDALPEPGPPVLGRVDHHWENLLVDRESGSLEGVVDWGETPAVPRGFSLALVEWSLARDWWMALPEVPDRRPQVRAALLAGYREHATVPSRYAARRACYHLNLLVRELALFEDRAGAPDSGIPGRRVEEAASEYRRVAEAELESGGP